MARRPKANLDSLAVPKEPARRSEPPPATAPKAYERTLSLRMTSDQYRRLRRYVAAEEERTGRRSTHQSIIETALDEFLTARNA